MVVKKRDFQKTAGLIQEFLSKLACEESTAELRDSMNLVLFYLQKYYKKLRSRSLSEGISPRFNNRSCSGSLILNGGISPVSPACGTHDQFEWKWYNLESPRLSASLGTNEFSSLPPFLQAAKSGNSEELNEILNQDSEAIHQVDGLGRNAVMYCIHGNTPVHNECLEMLINGNSDLNHQANDSTTALHVAAYCNNTTALTLLLRNKASINTEDNQGRTSMHWAAASPSVDDLKLLLQFGGNISAADREGLTPAMWACHFDQLQNLQLLQQALSRIDPQEDAIFRDTDCYGQSVIHWAVKGTGPLECLEALLSPHSVILKDNDGKTVLHTAAERGNSAACEMILEIRGIVDGLQDVDKVKRTPAHLAAICGQGEVVNFLLEQGADLRMKDAFGASAIDYIHNKQLNYCRMVLMAHVHVKEQQITKDLLVPTAPSDNMKRQDHQSYAPRPQSASPVQTGIDQANATDTPDEHLIGSLHDQNIDVSDLQGFEVHSGSVSMGNEQTRNTNDSDDKKRRQSTLIRQTGFVNDNDTRQLMDQAPSFDLRTEDGDVLVVVSNLDIEGDDKDQIIDVEEGEIEIDCEDNFGYSSAGLREGRGSASSVHSEPDNADNCSVSVELSATSLGSDNEEELNNEEFEGHDSDSKPQTFKEESVDSRQETFSELHKSGKLGPVSPSQEIICSPKHSRNSSQKHSPHVDKISVCEDDYHLEQEQENMTVASKKKKDKAKKKKEKGPAMRELVSPLPPPRGMVPPLQGLGPPGAGKLGVVDPRVIKPAPWGHGNLGPLRKDPPEPAPPRPISPRMGQRRYPLPEDGESDFVRPRTPEPPRSPHEVEAHQSLQPPSHTTPSRGPMEGGYLHDREMGYGSLGPPHGPLAHADGQALLKGMDVIGKSPKMESWIGKSVGRVMPHGPLGPRPPGQQTYFLHGPVPHPPQH